MRIIRRIILIILLIGLGALIYKFFFDCERNYGFFEKEFTLKENDYVIVDDEAIVKLIKIKDSKTDDDISETKYKVIVLNNRHLKYVTLASKTKTEYDLEKFKYVLELKEAGTEEATFVLAKKED